MKLSINYKGKSISTNIKLADSFMDRLVGLMFRNHPVDSEGLLLVPGNSIHTCFMKYPLDIVFISSKNQVVKIIRDMKPWRMTRIYFSAVKTLEMPAGKIPTDLKEGDSLEITNV